MMEQIIVPLLFVFFLFTLKFYTRFWILLFVLLRKCWFPLFTALLASFIFSGSAQGVNIINEIEFTRSGIRKYTTLVAIFLWAYNCYKLSKTALDLFPLTKACGDKVSLARNISTYVPFVMGLLPFAVALLVFLTVKETPDVKVTFLVLAGAWFFLIYLLLLNKEGVSIRRMVVSQRTLNILSLYIFVIIRLILALPVAGINALVKWEENKRLSWRPEPYHYIEHWRNSMRGEQILNWLLHVVLYVSIAIWPIYFAKLLGPIGLICIAMSFFVIVGTLFLYMKYRMGFHILPLVVAAAVIFSALSDNNKVGVIRQGNDDTREELSEHFRTWVKKRVGNSSDTLKISLVAAEGGGLRSAYWTYGILRKLQQDHPRFYNNLYAISSVSGGSLGSALFCSEQIAGYSEELAKAPIINEDNLSPMIAGLFYIELAQSLLPVDLECLDRSKVMNETFEWYWNQRHAKQPLWSENFLQLWKHDHGVPALFINSIHVESGSSALFSNLRFDSTQISALDMMHLLQNKLPLSAVVGISARFPYVQPPAKFDDSRQNTWGHLADGGYFENSGVATIFQIYLRLREEIEHLKKEGRVGEVQISILSITNGIGLTTVQPTKLLNELNSPLNTLLNSWYTRGYSYAHMARQTLGRINRLDRFYEVKLSRKNSAIPLGWYLSATSREEIAKQVKKAGEDQEYKLFTRYTLSSPQSLK